MSATAKSGPEPSNSIILGSPHPVRLFITTVLVSVVIGVGISYIVSFGSGETYPITEYVAGGWIGGLIASLCLFFDVVLAPLFRRVPEWMLRAVSFFLGGTLGFVIGNLVSGGVGWTGFDLRELDLSRTLFFGLFSVAIGIVIHTIESLRLNLRRSIEQVKEIEFAEKELETARQLQQSLLPPTEVFGAGYRVDARNLPAQFVAGDFYDVFAAPDGSTGVALGDVSGKGMAASLVMATVKAMLPLVCQGRGPAEALRELNQRLAQDLPPRSFVALTLCEFTPSTRKLVIANAGLPDPYIVRHEEPSVRPIVVPGPRLPLGLRAQELYEETELTLEHGEHLVLLSDGLPEQPFEGEPLGYERFEELLAAAFQQDATPPLDELVDSVERLGRSSTTFARDDDWTVLSLQTVED